MVRFRNQVAAVALVTASLTAYFYKPKDPYAENHQAGPVLLHSDPKDPLLQLVQLKLPPRFEPIRASARVPRAQNGVSLDEIRTGSAVVTYDPSSGERMIRSGAIKDVQQRLQVATGRKLKYGVDGAAGPETLQLARYYACSRGLEDRSGAITAELLRSLEKKRPALPPVRLETATLDDVARERLDSNGTPIVLNYHRQGKVLSTAFRQVQELLAERGYDLGYWGADGRFGDWCLNEVVAPWYRAMGFSGDPKLIDATAARALLEGQPPQSVQQELGRVGRADWFQGLSESWKEAIARFVSGTEPAKQMNFLDLTKLDTFLALDDQQRKCVLNIAFNSTSDGLKFLRRLVARTDSGGKPIILDPSSEAGTLIDYLHEIVRGPLHEGIADEMRPQIIQELLQEIFPLETTQAARHGVCAEDAWRCFLMRNPGEEIRIYVGLLQPDGKVRMRSGGVLVRNPDTLAPDESLNRGLVRRVVNAAGMEFANGNRRYDNRTDRHIDPRTGRRSTQSGLTAGDQRRLVSARTGEPFESCEIRIGYSAQRLLSLLVGNAPLLTPVSLRWRPPTAEETRNGETDNSYHAVNYCGYLTGERNGKTVVTHILFRNPHGPTQLPNGTEISDDGPVRVVHDREQGIYSFSIEVVRERINSLLIEKSLLKS